MSVDHKASVKATLERYFEKQAKASDRAMKRGGKKNKAPEKEFEKVFIPFATRLGFDLHVVESKAVYSPGAGRFLRSMTSESLPDLIGNHGELSVWIELKAKGRLNTLKAHQKEFLEKKISAGCFACCIDSIDRFRFLWDSYLETPSVDQPKLLFDALP